MVSEFRIGDEVIWKDREEYDVLTILQIREDGTAVCFEYNPQNTFNVAMEELELL